jgi:hypothetical protein
MIIIVIISYGTESFVTDPSQMNLIGSRCYMYYSRLTMISWRWDARCGASTKRICVGFGIVGLKSRWWRGFTAGRT